MDQDQYYPQLAKYPPLPPEPANTNGDYEQKIYNNGVNYQFPLGYQTQMYQQQQQNFNQPQNYQYQKQSQLNQQNNNSFQYQQQPQTYQSQTYQQSQYTDQQQQPQQVAQLTVRQICAKSSDPVQIVCPKCNKLVITNIQYQRARGIVGLAAVTLTLGTVKAVKDKYHSCPNCNEDLGVCKFIESKNLKKKR
ncbi:hypothetical protein ABPG72_021210 [Tetrahymena utriculariae]